MKLLFVGDVVGAPGRQAIEDYLPKLKKKYKPQVTIVNGENAANGKGITEKIYKQLLQAGADVVTLGNHAFDNRDIFEFIDDAKKMVRPANYPVGVPGQGMVFVKSNQVEVCVINLQGRVFMNTLDDPFQVIQSLIETARKRTPIIFVDFHAEVTSEKQAMGWFLDGKVTAVIGTHTHVQTNDARVLPQGTAVMCDVGMTGPYNGILGMEREAIIGKFLNQLPTRFEVSDPDEIQLSACFIECDDTTGKVKKILPIKISPDQPFME